MITVPAEHVATEGVCDVCRLVDGDITVKPVLYCGMCEANICEACRPNWSKRLHALFLSKKENLPSLS